MLRSLEIDLVIDVGANRGQYGKFLRDAVGYSGAILSFEPNDEVFEHLLNASRADRNWEVSNLALGDKDEKKTFNVMRDNELSSFLSPTVKATRFLEQANTLDSQQTVKTRRLDSLTQEDVRIAKAQRIYLKLDTQGFDLQVLSGVEAILDKIVGGQTEVSFIPIYEGMPNYVDSLATLEELGFALTGLFPVSRTEDLRVVEMDAIFRRKESSKVL